MKVWAFSNEYPEGKFLVVRRDGTVPAWPHFVLGARDPAAPAALRAYAEESKRLGVDPEYVSSLLDLAASFEAYRANFGNGDPDAPPHRTDDPAVLFVMRGGDGAIIARHEPNKPKPPKPVQSPTPVESVPEMRVNDIKSLFPLFAVDTFEHVLGHVSKAAGKIHGLVGDTDHIQERNGNAAGGGAEDFPRDLAFQEAEKANGKTVAAYIADLIICAAKLAALCPSGAIDLQKAITERMAEKRKYRDQYTTTDG